jgi:hypothetical protein
VVHGPGLKTLHHFTFTNTGIRIGKISLERSRLSGGGTGDRRIVYDQSLVNLELVERCENSEHVGVVNKFHPPSNTNPILPHSREVKSISLTLLQDSTSRSELTQREHRAHGSRLPIGLADEKATGTSQQLTSTIWDNCVHEQRDELVYN